jgi:phosphate starvation-inducible membrane PsiE
MTGRWVALHCHSCPMIRPLRALASLLVGITTVVGMIVYEHYSREPPTDIFTAALAIAATILTWVVTGLE